MKIDVEGHEADVIRGAAATLAREHPVLLVEIEERHVGEDGVREVIRSLLDLGYHGTFSRDGRPTSIAEFDVARDQRPYASELPPRGAHPRYVNNFLFTSGR